MKATSLFGLVGSMSFSRSSLTDVFLEAVKPVFGSLWAREDSCPINLSVIFFQLGNPVVEKAGSAFFFAYYCQTCVASSFAIVAIYLSF